MTSDCIKSHCENPVNSGIGLRLQTVPNCPKLQVMNNFTNPKHISEETVLLGVFQKLPSTKGNIQCLELIEVSEFA